MTTANISPKDVMALRERTGLGMMDCKAALIEANGDPKLAEERLREKLKGKMDTRTDRAAGEGCVTVAIVGNKACICEVRAETDFTARNPEFREMANELAVLKVIEQSILDVFASEMAGRAGDFAPRRLRHLSLSKVVLKCWELARQLPNENLALEDLCAASGVSARQVQNAFIEMTGLRPTAFLRAHRLQRAKRMLLTGEARSVKAAAYTCGFMDLGRFSASFRKLFGEPPSQTLARFGIS